MSRLKNGAYLDGIYVVIKEKEIITCRKMDATGNKPDSERQMPHVLSYMDTEKITEEEN